MKNALILHGAGNNHTGNWFPWLKDQLEKNSYTVWVPDLPNSEKPDRRAWEDTILSSGWKFDDQSIIIGHSAGATLALRILEVLPVDISISKAILVAGPANLGAKPEFYVYKKSLVEGSFQWEKIRKSCQKFYYFCSENDPYDCGIEQSKIFYEHIGGEILLREDQGHFNLEKSPAYTQFPELLEKILE